MPHRNARNEPFTCPSGLVVQAVRPQGRLRGANRIPEARRRPAPAFAPLVFVRTWPRSSVHARSEGPTSSQKSIARFRALPCLLPGAMELGDLWLDVQNVRQRPWAVRDADGDLVQPTPRVLRMPI